MVVSPLLLVDGEARRGSHGAAGVEILIGPLGEVAGTRTMIWVPVATCRSPKPLPGPRNVPLAKVMVVAPEWIGCP